MKTRMLATAFDSGRGSFSALSRAAQACGLVSMMTVRREGARSSESH